MKSRLSAALLVLVVTVLAIPNAVAQQTATTIAPVPAPILTAQKIFLANGGADLISAEAFKKAGQIEEPYNSTYTGLRAWGHWQLVPAPESADLVLVVRFTAPIDSYSNGLPLSSSPQIELTIFDGKTHFPLWALTQPVNGAFRKNTWQKNYADGIAGLIGQLKSLTATAAP